LLPRYSFSISEPWSYNFTTDSNHHYLLYLSESQLVDSDGNSHTLYNIGFSRDDDFVCDSFTVKFDSKIRNTILFILNRVLQEYEHRALIYFCFGDDGYARHRKIIFNSWSKLLNIPIAKYDSTISYEGSEIYGSLILLSDNPLKGLIIEAFTRYISEINEK
jgi:hypothetical protein